MTQNDPNNPDEPLEPPPIVRMEAPPLDDRLGPEEVPDADRDWQLFDAEEQSKKLPATFVNRSYVKMEGRLLRISFGEGVGDENIYRSVIVMTPEDAYELGQLLTKQAGAAYGLLLDHYRQALEAIKPAGEPNG